MRFLSVICIGFLGLIMLKILFFILWKEIGFWLWIFICFCIVWKKKYINILVFIGMYIRYFILILELFSYIILK